MDQTKPNRLNRISKVMRDRGMTKLVKKNQRDKRYQSRCGIDSVLDRGKSKHCDGDND